MVSLLLLSVGDECIKSVITIIDSKEIWNTLWRMLESLSYAIIDAYVVQYQSLMMGSDENKRST